MRILLVSQTYLRKDLGAAKVLIELAEELERDGWQCRLRSLPDIVGAGYRSDDSAGICQALRGFLVAHADEFDVIDYDHVYLPFPRKTFARRPLFVARSILLHRPENPIPPDSSLKSKVRRLILGSPMEAMYRQIVSTTRVTVAEADLINVANHDDEAELIRWGLPADKLTVQPYGLSRDRQALFASSSVQPPPGGIVAFIGTFDQRKGAADFPLLVRETCARVATASFLLLGTGQTEAAVLSRFPAALRSRIKVTPSYDPMNLPALLAPCSLGVFPSYLESFGFGVLEMLAAAMPVVAYDCPGPPMMLPEQYLVRRGAVVAMAEQVAGLLRDRAALEAARSWAKSRATAFSWAQIARDTGQVYRARYQMRARADSATVAG